MVWTKRLLATLRSSVSDKRLEQELATHLEALEEEYQKQGMSDIDAKLAAKRAFGPIQQIKEEYRQKP